ncbi:NADPH-dependent F420 reductase [Sphingomonas sp. 28-63-12]|uniref:NADPH-dependent F420 reductase n=1 Tax=Sphingomonas sp. 28-63-12 TaxID=1970434 RepID=UPI000BC64667|nr:MAG: NADPH-dependent F420 reductase [Sphingomonas sp. 28-63-12]
MLEGKTIAVIGGSGKLGGALAGRWQKAGLNVIIGSRAGMPNAAAAALADIVVVTVPFAAQAATIADIASQVAGKIVIDTTVPLVPPKVMRVQLPPEGSAAMAAKALLGDGVTVISGFHNVAAHKLATDQYVDCDVLVFGDDKVARGIGIALAEAAGLRGLHGGALINSAAAEALTSVLIFLNKTYKVDGAGIKITGTLIDPVD